MTINSSNDDFGLICTSAVRYALGRRTYMPSVVIKFISDNLDNLDSNMIYCIESDIREYGRYGEDAYGDECDKKDWLAFDLKLRDILITKYGYAHSAHGDSLVKFVDGMTMYE
jgi:hypothetical protein